MYRGMNSARMDGPGAKMSISRRGSTPRVGGCCRMKRERTCTVALRIYSFVGT